MRKLILATTTTTKPKINIIIDTKKKSKKKKQNSHAPIFNLDDLCVCARARSNLFPVFFFFFHSLVITQYFCSLFPNDGDVVHRLPASSWWTFIPRIFRQLGIPKRRHAMQQHDWDSVWFSFNHFRFYCFVSISISFAENENKIQNFTNNNNNKVVLFIYIDFVQICSVEMEAKTLCAHKRL